jgi:hypothetical protein
VHKTFQDYVDVPEKIQLKINQKNNLPEIRSGPGTRFPARQQKVGGFAPHLLEWNQISGPATKGGGLRPPTFWNGTRFPARQQKVGGVSFSKTNSVVLPAASLL